VDDAVALAAQANVKRLFLFHHDPSHDDEKITQMAQWGRSFVATLNESLQVDAAREGLEVVLQPSPK
jgi:ribonuclease BN (tRNA processing enzyme)